MLFTSSVLVAGLTGAEYCFCSAADAAKWVALRVRRSGARLVKRTVLRYCFLLFFLLVIVDVLIDGTTDG